MQDEGKKLNVKQVQALELLMRGMTQKAVADAVVADQKTVSRWMRQPEFAAELQRRKDDLADAMEAQSASGAQEALTRLHELVASENEGIALQACRTMLTSAARAVERRTLFDRMLDEFTQGAMARAEAGDAR